MKKHIGFFVAVAIAVIPVILWYIYASSEPLFNDASIAARTFGRVAGIAGMSLFAVNLILSARLKFLERFFNGMPALYDKHHLIGIFAFILILLHPLSLAAQFLSVSAGTALLLLVPSLERVQLLFGILAVIVMAASLLFTFFIRISYPKWKVSHKFLGLAFFLAAVHVFLIESDVSEYAPLMWYMIVLIGAAFIAYIYRSILGKYLVRQYIYTVRKVTRITDSITEIALLPLGKPMIFRPGQFMFVRFNAPNISSEPHPFSIISGASGAIDTEVSIAVKNLGDFTSKVKDIPAGSIARLEGAYGLFSEMGDPERDRIWIAGGIGVTPFVGMARSLKRNDKRHIDFYYAVNSEKEAVYMDDFHDTSARLNNFKVFQWFKNRDGLITAKAIMKHAPNIADREILICGPVPMMRSLRDQFRSMGVPNSRIHTEEFALK